jgi:hypothetical protein
MGKKQGLEMKYSDSDNYEMIYALCEKGVKVEEKVERMSAYYVNVLNLGTYS